MVILGWIIWVVVLGYGLFCLVAFLYEMTHPLHPTQGLQIYFPVHLRRLISGFEAFGFLVAAVVTGVFHISKFHLLWFAPVWYFWGIPRWFEWIYFYYNPDLIDLFYPVADIPLWISVVCPFSTSLIPDLIRKINKSNRKKMDEYQHTIDCIAKKTMSSKEIELWNERRIKGDRFLETMDIPHSPYSNIVSEIKRIELIENAIDSIEDITTLNNVFEMAEKAKRCVNILLFLERGWHLYSSYRLMPKLIKRRAVKRLSILRSWEYKDGVRKD